MPRRKIGIEFIEEKQRRYSLFSKRKRSLFKLFREINELTNAEYCLCMKTIAGVSYCFSSSAFKANAEKIADQFFSSTGEQEAAALEAPQSSSIDELSFRGADLRPDELPQINEDPVRPSNFYAAHLSFRQNVPLSEDRVSVTERKTWSDMEQHNVESHADVRQQSSGGATKKRLPRKRKREHMEPSSAPPLLQHHPSRASNPAPTNHPLHTPSPDFAFSNMLLQQQPIPASHAPDVPTFSVPAQPSNPIFPHFHPPASNLAAPNSAPYPSSQFFLPFAGAQQQENPSLSAHLQFAAGNPSLFSSEDWALLFRDLSS